MLLLESCPSYQSRPSTMTRSMHLFLTRMGRHTRCKIAASRYYNTLHDSRMACPIRRNAQCCQQDGRSNCNLIIKRTLCCHCHACRQWLSRGAFLGSEHFVLYSAGILLNGYDFTRTGAARTGAARLSAARQGAARPGLARPGLARQTHHSSKDGWKFAGRGGAWHGAARQGQARQGPAWLGLARLGKHTASLRGCRSLLGKAWPGVARRGWARQGKARRGRAWLGEARLGKARPGKARQGKANTLRSTERSS